MTICNDLRQAVLQAAVEGKLSQQLPTDSSVDDLLASITAEKVELVKQKKIKEGKYSKTISEDPFDIPDSWRFVKLGDISKLVTKQTGFDYSQNIKPYLIAQKTDGTIPFIQTRNFKGKDFSFDTAYYAPSFLAEKFPNIALNSKCLLLSIVGASIGNVGLFNHDVLSLLGGAIAKVVLLNEGFYEFLYCYLQSPRGFDQIMKNYKSTAQGTITVEDVRNIIVPFPPLPEQHRIVAKVDELMAKIDELEKTEKTLEAIKADFPGDMKAAVLQAAMQGKLTEQLTTDSSVDDLLASIATEKEELITQKKIKKEKYLEPISVDEIPFDIPDNWRFVRLKDISVLKNGYSFKKTEYKTTGVQVVRISDLSRDQISTKNAVYYTENNILDNYLISNNSILICMTGSIGKMAIVKTTPKAYLNQRVGMLIPSAKISLEYIYHYLSCEHIIFNWNKAKTSTNGNIKSEDITDIVIPIPPIEEQQRIVEKLDALLPLCDSLDI